VAVDAGLHLHGQNRLDLFLGSYIAVAGRTGYVSNGVPVMAEEDEIREPV